MKIKTAKSMISKYIQKERDDRELHKLHNVLFHIMKDVKNCCVRHNLTYMLGGGTLLGAIRHGGFIPWDDDVDIMMPRKDCELLVQAMKDDYGDKYDMTDPKTHIMSNIMLNGTAIAGVLDSQVDNRINIDVFPIDNMPKRKCRFKAFKLYFYRRAEGLIEEYKNPSPIIVDLCAKHRDIAAYYRKRRMLGKFLRLFGTPSSYRKKSIKMCKYKKVTGYLGIPTAISYNREKFAASVLSELSVAQFCGEEFSIPKHYDIYLKNLYGDDYMVLPPPEKREVHAFVKMDFGIYANLNDKGEFDTTGDGDR